MRNKVCILFLVLALTLGIGVSTTHASAWTNAIGDGNWFDAGNWTTGFGSNGVPSINGSIGALIDARAPMNFNSAGAEALFLVVSNTSGFSISGGDLTYVGDGLLGYGGAAADPAVINQTGGTVTQTGGGAGCLIGHNSSGIYNISGGKLFITSTCASLCIDWTLDGTPSVASALTISGNGVVEVAASALHLGPKGTLTVFDNGVLIWRNHTLADLSGNVQIGTYNVPVFDTGSAVNAIATQVGSDVHFVANTFIAHGPDPADGAKDVPVDKIMSWHTGDDPNNLGSPNPKITDHLVYFSSGADPNLVLVATIPVANPAQYDPPANLSTDKTYYWRVDEKLNDSSILAGRVWTFDTIKSLPILVAPFIKDVVVALNGTAEFTVTVDSLSPVHYAWKKFVEEGDDLDVGTDSPTLTISNAQLTDEGFYYCQATNLAGTVVSGMTRLAIKGLIGHWTFDETLEDSSINGNDGILRYTNPSDPDPNWATGIIGSGAIVLDGIDDYVEIPNESDYDFYDTLTVSCWVKGTPVNYSGIVGKWDGTVQSSWLMYQSSGGTINFLRRRSGPADVNISSGVNGLNDQWHYLVGTYDISTAGEQKVYVDGVLKASLLNNKTAVLPGNAPIIIGQNSGSLFYKGLIDDVRIYNYTLSNIDIAVLYTNVVGGNVCLSIPTYDFNKDCRVDIQDFAAFAATWMNCNLVPECLP